jgi:hypothetical protein
LSLSSVRLRTPAASNESGGYPVFDDMRERAWALIAVFGVTAALGGCGTKPGAYSTRWQLAWVEGRTLGIEVPGCAKPALRT